MVGRDASSVRWRGVARDGVRGEGNESPSFSSLSHWWKKVGNIRFVQLHMHGSENNHPPPHTKKNGSTKNNAHSNACGHTASWFIMRWHTQTHTLLALWCSQNKERIPPRKEWRVSSFCCCWQKWLHVHSPMADAGDEVGKQTKNTRTKKPTSSKEINTAVNETAEGEDEKLS